MEIPQTQEAAVEIIKADPGVSTELKLVLRYVLQYEKQQKYQKNRNFSSSTSILLRRTTTASGTELLFGGGGANFFG